MTDAPIILLDVDGTLVRLPYDIASHPGMWQDHCAETHPTSDEDWIEEPFHTGIMVRVRKPLVEALQRWQAAGAELMWLTSWFGAANQYLAGPLGLPQLPILHDEGGDDWKFTQAQRIAEQSPGRTIVWAEDEELDAPQVLAWAKAHGSTLLVPCDKLWGIDDTQIEAIDRLVCAASDPTPTRR